MMDLNSILRLVIILLNISVQDFMNKNSSKFFKVNSTSAEKYIRVTTTVNANGDTIVHTIMQPLKQQLNKLFIMD